MLNSLEDKIHTRSRTLTVRQFTAFIISDTLGPKVIGLVTSVNNGLALATVAT